MNNKFILVIFMIVMTIAYLDMLDSFKHFDRIVSQMLELDGKIKTEIDINTQQIIKIQKLDHQ